MKRRAMKLTVCLLAAGMTVSATDSVAFAAKGSSLAGLGAERNEETELQTETAVQSVDGQAAESETQAETAQQTEAETEATAETVVQTEEETQEETVAETEATLDTSMNGQLAFAQCDEYINVRSEASADSEVVGKVYNNGSVTILGQIGDWYQVQSGNATGYVNAAYFATGEEAQAIADEVAYNVATVYPEALTVRSEPSEDSEPIGTVYSTDELEVVQYDGDWMKVALGNDVYGYVSAYYVGYDTYYATAETLDEEQARLDQEWLDYLAESEAEEERLNQQWQDYLDQQAAEQAAADQSYQDQAAADQAYQEQLAAEQAAADAQAAAAAASQQTSDAQTQADQAYQAYLDAQAAADAATQQGDEQNIYDTAAAAQQAYQAYLNAQAAADAQAQAEADAAAQAAQAAANADAAAQQTQQAQTEAPQTEAPQTEAPQTEAPQTEAPQETAPETEAPSYSSTGSQVVNFATQFLGNPYVWGGTSLTNGADCSGFTQSVFANFGISIPRTAAAQASSGTPVSLSDIQAGDLLFYSNGSGIGHVTIYMGNGQVVHASNSNTGIIISDYGYRTPVSARRYW